MPDVEILLSVSGKLSVRDSRYDLKSAFGRRDVGVGGRGKGVEVKLERTVRS